LLVNGTDASVKDPLDRAIGNGQDDIWGLSAKHDHRERLVIAAALAIAEIERIDRVAAR
jgi:hypothetical protein